jgi:hypothetical protein
VVSHEMGIRLTGTYLSFSVPKIDAKYSAMLSDYISMAIDGRGADQLVSAGPGTGCDCGQTADRQSVQCLTGTRIRACGGSPAAGTHVWYSALFLPVFWDFPPHRHFNHFNCLFACMIHPSH